MTQPKPYGIAAEFDNAGELVAAALAAREAGYRRFEVYSPYPIRELEEYISHWDVLSTVGFAAALCGGVIGFYMQFFIAADVYPTNIGGRPLNSWQAFAVITFALTVLFALFAVFFGALVFQGLPSLYHPLSRVPSFKRASDDAFFICIEARDGKFQATDTSRFLLTLDPVNVWEVDRE